MIVLDWKMHLALFPVYCLIVASLGIVGTGLYCWAIQFGSWGLVVLAGVIWFVGGLAYALTRKT